eukprot:2256356-Amphidinium_carterae.1
MAVYSAIPGNRSLNSALRSSETCTAWWSTVSPEDGSRLLNGGTLPVERIKFRMSIRRHTARNS